MGEKWWFTEHEMVGEPLGEGLCEPSLLCHRQGVVLLTASASSQPCALVFSAIAEFNMMRHGVYANMAFLDQV